MGLIELSDGTLLARARRGDAAAFTLLIRRYSRPAFAVALSVVANHADAEDISQDAWVKALERIEDCREPEKFASWFLQIVRNRARNYLQYRRVRAAEALDTAGDPAGSSRVHNPHSALDNKLRRAMLEKAIAGLSECEREVPLLHDLVGWKHRTIAESLGITEVLSRKRLFEARVRMRRFLGDSSSRRNQ